MKKIVIVLLAAIALAVLAVPALADADVRVAKKDLKVYEDQSTDSKVLMKIKKGREVLVDVDYGSWCGILVEDDEGQTLGWVQSKNLKCKHNWTDWETEREATCRRAGVRTRYCTRCGEEESKEISKLDHDFGKWVVERKGTCDRPGSQFRTCKVCGFEEEKELIVPHTFGRWSVIREATCTEEGVRNHTCEVCGHVERQVIKKLPHDLEYKIILEATDHSSGSRAKVCRVCGYTEDAVSYDPEGTLRRGDRGEAVYQLQQLLVDQGYLNIGGTDGIYGGGTEKAIIKFQADQAINADGIAWPQTQQRLNHDFGPWQTVKKLTRTESGMRQRVCKDCGYVQTETIEPGDSIERGSRGENVRAMQQILKTLGYDAGGFDGIYGPKLDNAFTAFDADHNLTFEMGKVRPADVDALVSAWINADTTSMQEGEADSPVNLALSVTPASDEYSDDDVTTYIWTLTNLGTEKCMFNALLLTYGEIPDFTQNDLVMVIDGEELKGNAGNSISGSFSVSKAWGDGNLNFAAMAVHEQTGAKWLSNTVTF